MGNLWCNWSLSDLVSLIDTSSNTYNIVSNAAIFPILKLHDSNFHPKIQATSTTQLQNNNEKQSILTNINTILLLHQKITSSFFFFFTSWASCKSQSAKVIQRISTLIYDTPLRESTTVQAVTHIFIPHTCPGHCT